MSAVATPASTAVTHHIAVGFAPGADLAVFDVALPPGRRVLVRTPRGVELARVLSTSTAPQSGPAMTILRPTEPADEWLIARLAKRKTAAVRRCQELLRRSGCTAALLDVDLIYDGGTMILRWLGTPDAISQTLVNEVVAEYQAAADVTQLAERIAAGCGPTCGQPGSGCDSGGCGPGGCAGCSVRKKP